MKQARKYGYGDHGFGFIRIIRLLCMDINLLRDTLRIRDCMLLKREKMIFQVCMLYQLSLIRSYIC